jgi:membrane protease YdiL (CAAX protease family)
MSSDEAVMKDRRAILTMIALLVTLGCAGLLLSRVQNEFASPRHFAAYEIVWWTLVGLLLSYVRWVERRPLTSIGLRKPEIRNILIGIAAGIAIFAGLAAIYLVILPALHFKEDPQVTQVMSLMLAKPLWWRLTLIFRGTIAEEIIFRGYAIERLQELTGSVSIAGIISCTVFALEHLGVWSWGHMIIAGFAGAILTLLYIWRRNLWVNTIAHFVPDGIGLLLG